jgi:hypothetical protein
MGPAWEQKKGKMKEEKRNGKSVKGNEGRINEDKKQYCFEAALSRPVVQGCDLELFVVAMLPCKQEDEHRFRVLRNLLGVTPSF